MTRHARQLLIGIAAAVVCALGAPAVAGAASWQLAPVPAPTGDPGQFPLGAIGDLKLIAANRAIVTAEGTSVMPKGIYAWDGVSWRVLASVCGGAARRARIAVAGPQEFWVIADTNPRQPIFQESTTLCRFRDGGLTSFAVPQSETDNWHATGAAACASAECWFGGDRAASNDGVRAGAFHLTAAGGDPRSVYAPFGASVGDIEAHAGTFYEAKAAPAAVEGIDPGFPGPLVRQVGGAFAPDPFAPAAGPPLGPTSEVLALDSDGATLWGGGSTNETDDRARRALAVVLESGAFRTLELAHPALRTGDRIADIAAVPGTTKAWAAIEGSAERESRDVPARVALIDKDLPGGIERFETLPAGGAPRGTARRIDCIAIDNCWLATAGGWLWHLTDGSPTAQDSGFFPGTITVRPRDGRSPQVRPDTPPVDDSLLFAAAPEPVQAPSTTAPASGPRRRALIARVRAKLRGRRTLVISFSLRRRATVRVVGSRGGRVVARSARRTLNRGARSLTLRVQPRRYPTRIRFETRESGATETPAPAAEEGVVTTSARFLDLQGPRR